MEDQANPTKKSWQGWGRKSNKLNRKYFQRYNTREFPEGSQGGSGGNYISVDFCQHSPFPFCRTKVSGAWLIIFKILWIHFVDKI